MMLWLLPLQRYFQFSGRAGRPEFWQFFAAFIIACVVAFLIDANSTNQNETGIPTIMLITVFMLIVPLSAVLCRRLHDINQTGRTAGLIPILWIVNVVASDSDGVPEPAFRHGIDNLFAAISHLAMFAVGGYLLRQAAMVGEAGPNQYGPPPTDTVEKAPKLNEVVASVSEKTRGFAPRPPAPDRLAQIERLNRLRQEGAITEEEFAQQKATLLAPPKR